MDDTPPRREAIRPQRFNRRLAARPRFTHTRTTVRRSVVVARSRLCGETRPSIESHLPICGPARRDRERL